ncbi:hypothetical protein R6Q59_028970 [Mikania micrantha]
MNLKDESSGKNQFSHVFGLRLSVVFDPRTPSPTPSIPPSHHFSHTQNAYGHPKITGTPSATVPVADTVTVTVLLHLLIILSFVAVAFEDRRSDS